MAQAFEMDVVLYQEGDLWIAQGLQFDITAQAKTPQDLPGRFMRTVASEIAVAASLNEEPLASIGEAPQKFWELWRHAKLTVIVDEEPAIRIAGQTTTTPRIVPRMKIAQSALQPATL